MDDESVNVVTLLAVLEHLEKPNDILKEIRRILKQKGLIIVTVPSVRSKKIIEFLAFKLNIISKKEVLDHKRYYTLKMLKDLMDLNNFEQFKLEYFELGHNLFFCGRKID